jgi:peptidoglycan/xylan/chitin deacetylase (PgdA/CDA1 family)
MLLKRSIVLAAGVLLFILAFIVYFEVARAQMEERFHQERVKYGVDGAILTESSTHSPAPAPAITNTSNASAPAAASDTNALIGPVPPPSSPAPDSTTAPSTTPTAPDTNSAPMPAPASTIDYPRANRSPFFQLAAYQPTEGALVQYLAQNTVSSTTVTPAPSTNTTAASRAPASSPAPASSTGGSGATHPPSTGDGSVIVLLFHQFKAAGVPIPAKYQWTMNIDVFEAEMKYIHDNGYHVIPMSDVLKFLRHQITVPPHSVCITIDDGYKSAIVYAYPVLKKYGYPWTFFIYPDFITVAEGSGAASWSDLLALQADGVDIESHSMTHPNLKLHHQKVKNVWQNFTPDEYAQWLNNETAGSKAILEQKMGKTITCFAYPYGEYNKQVEDAVIAAGYEAIFTVADNPVHATTDLHSIGRYTITQGVEKNFAAYLRQGALGLDAADPAPGATTSNPRPVITATLGYAGTLDPASIETSVRDFGDVRHDFDPKTNTIRIYLPRDLIQSVVLVNIRVKDAATGQFMVADWRFNYEPAGGEAAASHAPIVPTTTTPSASTNTPAVNSPPPAPTTPTTSTTSTTTNAPAGTDPEPLGAGGTSSDKSTVH